ncbi:MAG: hypothetical protein ACK5LV_01215 [Lachnospirales bacterium]
MFSDQRDVFSKSQKDFLCEKVKGKKLAYITSATDPQENVLNRL